MADSGLADKNILITGAARRLGRAMAIACAHQGANIIVHYNRSREDADALTQELQALGVAATAIKADISGATECAELFARTLAHRGSVDAVINNASIFPEDTVWEISEASILENLQVHALAPYHLAKAMHKSGQEGSIINLLDTRINDYDSQHLSYHLSKRMLFDLTRILAVELAPKIRVNGIAPGLILPPEGKDETYLQDLAHSNPLNTYGNPEDIARAAVFLLESPFITGQVINVDGGRHMKGNFYG